MEAGLEQCSRCGEAAVAFDAAGSCHVCQNCGYVLDDQGFVSYGESAEQLGEQQEQHGSGVPASAGTYTAIGAQVRHGGGVGGVISGGGGSSLPYGGRLAASVRFTADPSGQSQARRQRRELEELQGLGATLRLPGPVVRLAAAFLTRIHEAASESSRSPACHGGSGGHDAASGNAAAAASVAAAVDSAAAAAMAADEAIDDDFDEEEEGEEQQLKATAAVAVPTFGGHQSAARLGALLYLASRSERGTLTLAEVAVATTTDMFRVGELARRQAAFLRLSLPAVDLERFVLRMALELITCGALAEQQLPQPPSASAGGADGSGGDGGGGGAAARAPLSESVLRSHPLVRSAGQLAALVVRRGWHEGRTPRTVAGALLSICLDAVYPPGPGPGPGSGSGSGCGPVPTAQLARIAMCGASQLTQLKQEVLGHLTRLAAGLPFGPLVGPSNVASYLDVLVAADAVLGGLQDPQ